MSDVDPDTSETDRHRTALLVLRHLPEFISVDTQQAKKWVILSAAKDLGPLAEREVKLHSKAAKSSFRFPISFATAP
jgi:hypothetical protein